MTDKYEICSQQKRGGNLCYVLRKTYDGTNADFIRLLSESADIRTFAEQVPSMNDIFLRVVGNND